MKYATPLYANLAAALTHDYSQSRSRPWYQRQQRYYNRTTEATRDKRTSTYYMYRLDVKENKQVPIYSIYRNKHIGINFLYHTYTGEVDTDVVYAYKIKDSRTLLIFFIRQVARYTYTMFWMLNCCNKICNHPLPLFVLEAEAHYKRRIWRLSEKQHWPTHLSSNKATPPSLPISL